MKCFTIKGRHDAFSKLQITELLFKCLKVTIAVYNTLVNLPNKNNIAYYLTFYVQSQTQTYQNICKAVNALLTMLIFKKINIFKTLWLYVLRIDLIIAIGNYPDIAYYKIHLYTPSLVYQYDFVNHKLTFFINVSNPYTIVSE
jgi:hypothetical protein